MLLISGSCGWLEVKDKPYRQIIAFKVNAAKRRRKKIKTLRVCCSAPYRVSNFSARCQRAADVDVTTTQRTLLKKAAIFMR